MTYPMLILLLLATAGAGWLVIRFLGSAGALWRLLEPEVCVFAALLAGVGVLGYLGFALLALGWLTPTTGKTAVVILAAVAIHAAWSHRQFPFRCRDWLPARWLDWFLLLLFLIPSASVLIRAFSVHPFIDDYMYHITLPKQWLLHGGLREFPYSFVSNHHFVMQFWSLFGFCFQLDNFMPAKFRESLALIGMALMVKSLVRRTQGSTAGWIAGILWMIHPGASEFTATAQIDLSHGACLLLGIVLLDRATGPCRQRSKFYMLAGLFLGLHIGSKVSGYLYSGIVIAAFLGSRLASTHRPRNVRRLLAPVRWVLPGIVACSLPWMIKNFLVTGNPTFPLLAGVFPCKPAYMSCLQDFLALHRLDRSFLDPVKQIPDFVLNSPNVAFNRIVSISLVALVACLAGSAWRRQISRFRLSLACILVPAILLAPMERYTYAGTAFLLAFLVEFATLIGLSMVRWSQGRASNCADGSLPDSRHETAGPAGENSETPPSTWRPSTGLTAFVILLGYLPQLWGYQNRIRTLESNTPRYGHGLFATTESIEEEHVRALPEADCVRYLEESLPAGSLVLDLELHQGAALTNIPILAHAPLNLTSTLGYLASEGFRGEALRAKLLDMGVTHVLAADSPPADGPEVKAFREQFLRPVYRGAKTPFVVYEIVQP